MIALLAGSGPVMAESEPSRALFHASVIGIRDVCRFMVRQDTIVVRAEFRDVMGNRVEEFLGLEKQMDYILEYAFVTRCGVDLYKWREDIRVSGDTMFVSLPEPVLLGRSVCPERTIIIAWSSGSFLTRPFSLNDLVMSDLMERMWANRGYDLERILRECKGQIQSTLQEQIPLLLGVECVVVRWGRER